jgi:hypothetical protein
MVVGGVESVAKGVLYDGNQRAGLRFLAPGGQETASLIELGDESSSRQFRVTGGDVAGIADALDCDAQLVAICRAFRHRDGAPGDESRSQKRG